MKPPKNLPAPTWMILSSFFFLFFFLFFFFSLFFFYFFIFFLLPRRDPTQQTIQIVALPAGMEGHIKAHWGMIHIPV